MAFLNTLSDALQRAIKSKAEVIGGYLSKYSGILSAASLAWHVDAGWIAEKIGKAFSNVELDELKLRVNGVLVSEGRRVAILIDDIDRLDRDEIHAILKLVRLSASFHNTAYVLAFDDEVVAASLGGAMVWGRGSRPELRGEDRQDPLHWPDAEADDLMQLVGDGVEAVLSANSIVLSREQLEAFARHFQKGILPVLRTPRQVKRIFNSLQFAVALLKGEVNTVDQLLLEALRSVYPDLYLSIRANQDIYTGGSLTGSIGDGKKEREAAKAVVEAGLGGLDSKKREAALDLLRALFPQLEAVFGHTSYGDNFESEWTKERKIASSEYLRRYFQYSVPRRDVSDADVSAAVTRANSADETSVVSFFKTVSERNAWTSALDKLFASTPKFTPTGAKATARALAIASDNLPEQLGMFAEIFAPRSRAAQLASNLIQTIPSQGERLGAAQAVMNTNGPLSFGAEFLRCLPFVGKAGPGRTALTEPEIADLGAILAQRIAKAISTNPDYASYGRKITTLLYLWNKYGPKDEMAEFFKKQFGEHKEDAIKLLDSIVGRVWGLESGLSMKSEFDRSDFDSNAQSIEPTILLEALKNLFPGRLESVTLEKCWELKGDLQTACRFAAILDLVESEKAAQTQVANPVPTSP